ncbi:hypothetical protein VTN02DRAFT_4524 [Thermoascus thermophilus]
MMLYLYRVLVLSLIRTGAVSVRTAMERARAQGPPGTVLALQGLRRAVFPGQTPAGPHCALKHGPSWLRHDNPFDPRDARDAPGLAHVHVQPAPFFQPRTLCTIGLNEQRLIHQPSQSARGAVAICSALRIVHRWTRARGLLFLFSNSDD